MIKTTNPPIAVGNYLAGILFASLAVIQLVDRNYLDAGIWAAFALALASLGNEARRWADIPRSRKIAGLLFLAGAVGLFALRVGVDFGH